MDDSWDVEGMRNEGSGRGALENWSDQYGTAKWRRPEAERVFLRGIGSKIELKDVSPDNPSPECPADEVEEPP
jgi:hypothetical protein